MPNVHCIRLLTKEWACDIRFFSRPLKRTSPHYRDPVDASWAGTMFALMRNKFFGS